MNPTYAKETTVSVEKSRAEIEAVLGKYGADSFGYSAESGVARIGFRIPESKDRRGMLVRMTLVLPNQNDRAFTHSSRGLRSQDTAYQAWEQACRSRWRSLALVVKAKLEACAVGISTVEREFMADIVTPDGRTVGEIVAEQLPQLSKGKQQLRLMPGVAA